MITFFILIVLYGLILPYCGYKIVQKRIKKVSRIRKLIIERRALHLVTVKIHNEITNLIGQKEIMEIIQSDIDTIKIRNNYHKLYNCDLITHLEDNIDGNDFNKLEIYFNERNI